MFLDLQIFIPCLGIMVPWYLWFLIPTIQEILVWGQLTVGCLSVSKPPTSLHLVLRAHESSWNRSITLAPKITFVSCGWSALGIELLAVIAYLRAAERLIDWGNLFICRSAGTMRYEVDAWKHYWRTLVVIYVRRAWMRLLIPWWVTGAEGGAGHADNDYNIWDHIM